MKVLVILCAVVASCTAQAGIGYAYSAISPLTGYSSIAAPYSYAYSAPIISTPYAAPLAAPLAAPAPIVPVAAPVKTQHHSQDELGQAKYGHSEPLQTHEAVQDAHGNKIGSFSYVDPHGAVHRTDYVADAAGYRVASNDLPIAPAAPILQRRRRQTWSGPTASPVVTPTGHLADTPEVAAARAAHLTEHARQNTGAQAQPQSSSWNQAPAQSWNQASAAPAATAYSSWNQAPAAQSWNQAPAAQSWNQAPAAPAATPYSSWSQAPAAQSWNQAPAAQSWNQQPQASPVVGPGGVLADTPEVSAARASHFAEFNKLAAAAAAAPEEPSYSSNQAPAQSWNQGSAAPAATTYSSWNQAPAAQSWNQAPAQSWNQAPAAQSWNQAPAATAYSSWNQAPVAQSWNQSPSGGIPDTPEVAAAKAAHLAEHAAASRRTKRSAVLLQTPASTAPLATPLIAPYAAAPAISYAAAPAIPYAAAPSISYAAPAIPYATPLAAHGAIPVIRTDIVHNPGHAVSYRID